MKKSILFTLSLCVLLVLTASAQYTVDSVRKEYQAVHQWIADMNSGEAESELQYFDLNLVMNLPATGMHDEKIRMYFGEKWPGEEDDVEEWEDMPIRYLRFMTVEYNFSIREYYEEYLFDDQGRLLFVYAITPDLDFEGDPAPCELRMWLDGDSLLSFMIKKIDKDTGDLEIKKLRKAKYHTVYTGNKAPAESETDIYYRARAEEYLQMFRGIERNRVK